MSWKDKQSRYAGYVCLETVYLLLENALTECTVRLESDELERLRTCRLVMDEVPEKFDAFVRWPYYRMRGKPVTEEQEFEVIRRTERCVCPLFYNSHPYEVVSSCYFKNWWLDPHHFPAHYGWVMMASSSVSSRTMQGTVGSSASSDANLRRWPDTI